MSSPLLKSVMTVVFVAPLAVCGWLFAAEEVQTFDSAESAEAAGWFFNEEAQNPQRGCDGCETNLGWKSTNNAGGAAAGEGGGLLHRSFQLPIGFYADVTIGELTLEMPFEAFGQLSLHNIDFDGHAYIGFFNAHQLLEDPLNFGAEVGFTIAEPGGGVAPNYRWGQLFTGDDLAADHSNTQFVEGIPEGEPVDFALFYEPDVGAGAVTLVVGDEPPFVYELNATQRDAGATLNAFGVFTGHHGNNPRADSMEIFIDDVSYTSLAGGLQGDFNGDVVLDVADVDLLVGEIAVGDDDSAFDLTGDGIVDDGDLTTWLSGAATENGFGQAYLLGDANLDGSVDAIDLNSLALNWQQPVARWSAGDFTADGSVDAADLNALAINWQQSISVAASAVPEPTTGSLVLLLLFACAACRNKVG